MCGSLCEAHRVYGRLSYTTTIRHTQRMEEYTVCVRERDWVSRQLKSVFQNKTQYIQMCSESTLYTSPDSGLTSTWMLIKWAFDTDSQNYSHEESVSTACRLPVSVRFGSRLLQPIWRMFCEDYRSMGIPTCWGMVSGCVLIGVLGVRWCQPTSIIIWKVWSFGFDGMELEKIGLILASSSHFPFGYV